MPCRVRLAFLALCNALVLCAVGCVERRFIITTAPVGAPPGAPDLGAMVYNEKGLPLSASPADTQFVYYGKYRFTAIKDGYQTVIHEENIKAPWFEWFLLDFISENIIPWTIRDVRRIHIVMEPIVPLPPEAILDRAQQLRQRGQAEGARVPATPATTTSQLPAMPPAP